MPPYDLTGETQICRDFTAAAVIQNPKRLESVRDAFLLYEESSAEMTKKTLNEKLSEVNPAEAGLSATEFNAVMVSLTNTEAATEEKTTSAGYDEYTFSVHLQPAVAVLNQQIITATALEQLRPYEDTQTEVELVATLPREIEDILSCEVQRLDLNLRRMLMEASDVVRMANPYFDPRQWIIDDIAALPARGIDTRVLTREVTGENLDEQALDAVTAIVSELDAKAANQIQIRDFYETNETGHQTGAVHAKVISVDTDRCYIGSANLTGLNLRGNFEMGVILEGEIVTRVNEIFDAVFTRAEPVAI